MSDFTRLRGILVDDSMPGTGDTFKRVFDGDIAQCGCQWIKHPGYNDVLVLCEFHRQASDAQFARFERKRKRTPTPGEKP